MTIGPGWRCSCTSGTRASGLDFTSGHSVLDRSVWHGENITRRRSCWCVQVLHSIGIDSQIRVLGFWERQHEILEVLDKANRLSGMSLRCNTLGRGHTPILRQLRVLASRYNPGHFLQPWSFHDSKSLSGRRSQLSCFRYTA